ncbi:PEP-CTERM sorting domain-containing protein [Colwellia sp. Arc7-D]|jgi:hypothetical protein|uniref:PEP-CTERM sorting domain-containing protein n=1 Tax=Colwellia sp. Arc7-D TaxID=2161872 RepID=UPI000D3D208B|nr:PEP-CTERM sorting domain-containing protein [Colwellia sp. Arc7-D]AWB56155.1 hypothetical protein DBO93_00255 [Colwellia sp. Arc7-D]|tara:strand:- start:142 stop:732 length:591 start_codon:yes stop_codon:yes gene_type:complete
MKKLLILLTFWCAAITANASMITIDIEDKTYGINDTLTANIYISELEDNFGFQSFVSSFTFDFIFEESLLDFGQVTFGDKLDIDVFFPSERTDTYTVGMPLTISEDSYAFDIDIAQFGLSSFLLASIDFTVKGGGLAKFSFEKVDIAEFGFSHDVISAQRTSAQLGSQVTVPEPSSIAIFALALLMLASMTRKAKH